MAQDLEKLIVRLSADIKGFEREMQRAAGISRARAREIENRFLTMNRRLDAIGKASARALIAPLSGVAAALSVQEVMAYADAWTKAKNSLAVAGVVGSNQAEVLERIYQSAQRNAAPIGAMADLFGKASQAADNLGASQEDLLRFSDGVGVALRVAGKSSQEASGALTQLGQLLGQTRVSAEEFNSVGEGAQPVLIAVAAGLDRAGGSVSKLKQLVNEGKLSGREFFEAFLRGLPKVERMAANAAQTIDQGMTKIRNAFTRYIGQTDESLSGSERLVAGLNALADNFEASADLALKFAGILAGALVGRAIGSMLASVPQAVGTITTLAAAFRAGQIGAVAFSAALGPLGLIVGVAAGAAFAFGDWSKSISAGTRALAEQAASGAAVVGMISDVANAQEAYKSAIANTASAQTSATKSIVADTEREFLAKKALLELELKRQQALIAVNSASIAEKGRTLKADVMGTVFTRDDGERLGYSDPKVGRLVSYPDELNGLARTREALAANPLTDEIKQLRAETDLAEISATKLSEALNVTFASGDGGSKSDGGADDGKDKKKSGQKLDEYQQLTKSIANATAAKVAETDAQRLLNPTIEDYGFALEKARAQQDLLTAAKDAGKQITPQLAAQIDSLATSYANAVVEAGKLAESQDEVRQRAEEMRDFQKDMTRGIIDGFTSGAKAADIFANSLKKIGDKLLDMALNAAFDSKGGGGGGGLLGSILGGIGSIFTGGKSADPWKGLRLANGGSVRGPGTGRSDSIPAMLSNGEYVINAKAAAKNPVLLDIINSGKRLQFFADGGSVSQPLRAPKMPDLSKLPMRKAGGGNSVTLAPVYHIDATGADQAAVTRLEAGLAKRDREFTDNVKKAVIRLQNGRFI